MTASESIRRLVEQMLEALVPGMPGSHMPKWARYWSFIQSRIKYLGRNV